MHSDLITEPLALLLFENWYLECSSLEVLVLFKSWYKSKGWYFSSLYGTFSQILDLISTHNLQKTDLSKTFLWITDHLVWLIYKNLLQSNFDWTSFWPSICKKLIQADFFVNNISKSSKVTLAYIFLSHCFFWPLSPRKWGRFSPTISLSLHSARHTSAHKCCARLGKTKVKIVQKSKFCKTN